MEKDDDEDGFYDIDTIHSNKFISPNVMKKDNKDDCEDDDPFSYYMFDHIIIAQKRIRIVTNILS